MLSTITLDKLKLSPLNVRTNEEDANATAALESSILSHGLLMPLVAHPLPTKSGKPAKAGTEIYGVLAGGRRLRALHKLADRGAIPADYPVDVVIREMTDAEVTEASIAENLLRRELRPYEVFAAFKRANDAGASAEDIAERFGQRLDWVRQTLRLGNLAPLIFGEYAAGRLNDDQVRGYAATEDHELQLSVFAAMRRAPKYEHDGRGIRQKMKVGDGEIGRMLRFVSVEIYQNNGGRFELDLFAERSGEGRVVDEKLLRGLVEFRLHGEQAAIRTGAELDGELTFASVPPKDPKYGSTDYGLKLDPPKRKLSPEQTDRRGALTARLEQLDDESRPLRDEEGRALDEHKARLAEIERERRQIVFEIMTIEVGRLKLPPGQVVAVTQIDRNGDLDLTWWRPSRAAAKAGEKARGEIAQHKDDGIALDDRASPGLKQSADQVAKADFGLTQDGIEVARSTRRHLLRALLVENARRGGNVGHDYLIWSCLRLALDPSLRNTVGAIGLSARDRTPHNIVAFVDEQPGNQVWLDALAELQAQTFVTHKDTGGAFVDFMIASPEMKQLAAAVVAGFALRRSMNADGYRVDVHDVLAGATARAHPKSLRKLWQPTERFLGLFSKAIRLGFGKPFASRDGFASWGKLRNDEVTGAVGRLLRGESSGPGIKAEAAQDWVHPCLTFVQLNILAGDVPAPAVEPVREAA